MVDILTGMPSIVAALFIYAVFVTTFGVRGPASLRLVGPGAADDAGGRAHHRGDAQAGAERAARGVLRARRAEVEDHPRVVLPTALSGIITGVVLGMARVIGETAPLLILVGYSQSINRNPFSGPGLAAGNDLGPVGQLGSSYGLDAAGKRVKLPTRADRMWGAALTLIVIVMALNLIARLIARRSKVIQLTHHSSPTQRGPISHGQAHRRQEPEHLLRQVPGRERRQPDHRAPQRSPPSSARPAAASRPSCAPSTGCTRSSPARAVEGKVLLDGEDIYGAGVDPVDVRRTIGMVFQRPNPFPTMSIYDNVVAGLKLQGGRRSRSPTWTTWSSGRCAARTCGKRSRTG